MAVEPIVTVAYSELDQSPEDGYDESGAFWAVRRLRCAWANRLLLARQLKGGYRDNDSGSMVMPASYPPNEKARVRSVTCKPWGGVANTADAYSMAQYTYAELTVQYGMQNVSYINAGSTEERRFTSTAGAAAEFLMIDPRGKLWWETGAAQVTASNAPRKVVAVVNWDLTIHDVKTPTAALVANLGKINTTSGAISSTYLPYPAFTAAEYCVLYTSFGVTETFTPDGELRYDIALHFQVKNESWNMFYPPGVVTAEYMHTVATGQNNGNRYRPYSYADINAMIAAQK